MHNRKSPKLKKTMIIFFSFIGAFLAIILISRLVIWLVFRPYIHTLADVPVSKIAIVFGAGLTHSGKPTPILVDRVTVAATLYFEGKIQKILMSGDNRFLNYNEPGAMQQYAIGLGVPSEAIVMDYAGRRTYDTCFRAKAIFDVQDAILVTQTYHLPRALFTCSGLRIKVAGVSADLRRYQTLPYFSWQIRETVATFVALWDVGVFRPLPVLGAPEPIFPGEGK
jgi:SanA protein